MIARVWGQDMSVDLTPRSIFDQQVGGVSSDDLGYVVVFRDHRSHEYYVVEVAIVMHWLNDGERYLGITEPTLIHGEWVRPMTWDEERRWNEDRLMANVDMWGNIELHDTFDHEWYYNHCL